MVKSQQHTTLSHVAELIRNHGGQCLLSPVKADRSEQTELSGFKEKGNKMERSDRG